MRTCSITVALSGLAPKCSVLQPWPLCIALVTTTLLYPLYVYWYTLWIGHFQALWGPEGLALSLLSGAYSWCREVRPGSQTWTPGAYGKWGSSRREQTAGELGGEDLSVPSALGKSLDLSSPLCSKKVLESTISESAVQAVRPLPPACLASVGRWGWTKLLAVWVVGGKGSDLSCLTHYQQGNHRLSSQTSGRHWGAGVFLESQRQTCGEFWALLSPRSWEASGG